MTCFSLIGQTAADQAIKVDIIPPSPNALALGKYGEIPVSHYTGIPNINIPLYTVNSGKIELPISLSYHAGGLRVTENASWVGLGWSLNAGGVITRTVRGLPDEAITETRKGYNHNRELVKSYQNGTMSQQQKLLFIKGLADGQLDAEPDEYFFNFNGKSGRFIFDVNGQPVITPFQRIKIQLIENDISLGFILTDEFGSSYRFDSNEMTESTDACDLTPLPAFVSSWYLSSITPLNGNAITFSYDSGVIYQNFIPSESLYTLSLPGEGCTNISSNECAKEIKIYTKRLSQITWNGGKVMFKAQTKRTDLFGQSNDYRLDLVEFYGEQLVKKFSLQYDSQVNQKLFLNKLVEIDINNQNSDKNHIFTYHSPASVPLVTSKQQDHWGFYNNNPATTLVPKDVLSSIGGIKILPGADRSPDEQRTLIGILNKIKYPTGAHVDFEFELNDYGFERQQKVQDYVKQNVAVNMQVDNNLSFDSKVITVDFKQIVKISSGVNISSDGTTQPNYNEYAELRKIGGSTIFSSIGGINNKEFELDPGDYEIKISCENPNAVTYMNMWYQSNTDIIVKMYDTGGLRIKKIIKSDGAAVLEKSEYQYVMQNEPDRSSGVMMGYPLYSYNYQLFKVFQSKIVGCSYYVRTAIGQTLGSTKGGHVGYRNVRVIKDNELITDYAFTSFFEYPDQFGIKFPFAPPMSRDHLRGMLLSVKSKKQVGSSLVDVRAEYNNYKIRQENLFSSFGIKAAYSVKALSTNISDFSIVSYNDESSWVVQDSAIILDYDLNGQNPVRTYTKYYFDNPVHVQMTRQEKGGSGNYRDMDYYLYPEDFSSSTGFINTMKLKHLVAFPIEKVKARFYGDQANIVSGLIYEYDALGKGLIKNISLLNTNFRIASSDFKFSNRTLGTVPPSGALSTYQPDGKYSVKYKVLQHDQYGNPLEIKKQEEANTVYVWAYGGQYPIAEIKNATYTDVLAVLTQATINNLNAVNVSETTITNAVTKLRIDSRLSKAMISSYTYKPLVGMTSKTDPRGVSEYYEYDGLQRLKAVLDQVKNVTTSMDYHYRPN